MFVINHLHHPQVRCRTGASSPLSLIHITRLTDTTDGEGLQLVPYVVHRAIAVTVVENYVVPVGGTPIIAKRTGRILSVGWAGGFTETGIREPQFFALFRHNLQPFIFSTPRHPTAGGVGRKITAKYPNFFRLGPTA